MSVDPLPSASAVPRVSLLVLRVHDTLHTAQYRALQLFEALQHISR